MYKMLICDDERWIREGIRSSIDWSAMGIDAILTARDGEQAINMVRAEMPDVIITDIKMPNTNGLEMINAIKEMLDPKRIIVISGFSSFHYAQTALKLGVSDYILKPIDEDALISAVQKCLAEKRKDELADTNPVQLAVDRINLWLNRINNSVPDPNFFRDVFHIDITTHPFMQVVVCRKNFTANIETKNKDNSNQDNANYSDSVLVKTGSSEKPYIIFQSHESKLVGLFFYEQNDSDNFSSQVQKLFFEETKMIPQKFCIGVGNALRFEEGFLSYEQAEEVSLYRLLYPHQNIFSFTLMSNRKEKTLESFEGFNLSKPVTLLLNRRIAQYKSWINFLFETTKVHADLINPKEWKLFFIALVSHVSQIWKLNTDELKVLQSRIESAWNQETIQKELLLLPEKISSHEEPGIKQSFSLALEYIEKNYAAQITMTQAAEAIGLSASYFSKMFSECAGVSFLKFLTRHRMEKAKLMMKESSAKIYEIAEKVGYTDYRVFSRNFREYCGVSPADYRNHIV